MKLRIIGDVHADVVQYGSLIEGADCSVQLGDMGFKKTYAQLRAHVDPMLHKFIPGNHDDYDNLPAHALYPFGLCCFYGYTFFFISGAESADKETRNRDDFKSWWEQEQLSDSQMRECAEMYERYKPDFVLSHDCPTFITPHFDDVMYKPMSRTTNFLNHLYSIHQPNHWAFGHHHQSKLIEREKTLFIGIDPLGCVDFELLPGGALDWEVVRANDRWVGGGKDVEQVRAYYA